MAGLDILGGVGKGLMQGTQFVQQKKMQDEQLELQKEAQRQNQEYRDALLKQNEQQLTMQTELHGVKMNQAKELEAEQARLKRMAEIQTGLVKSHPDANPYQRHQLAVQQMVDENLFRGDELDKAFATREQLRNKIGVQAYDAALAGDIKPLQMILGEQGVAVDYTPDGKGLLLNRAGGKQEVIGVDGLLQMEAMAGARQAVQERRQADQEWRGKEAKILADKELAGMRSRSPRSGGGSSGSKTPTGRPDSPDNFDPLKLIREYKDAYGGGDLGAADGPPVDLEKGAEFYARIVTRNPEVTSAADGKAIAANAAKALASGQGRLSPEIGPDGSLQIVASVGANTYVFEDSVSEERLMRMQGLDGKPLAKDTSEVGTMYLQALEKLARVEPVAFQGAVMARDPKGLAETQDDAKRNDAAGAAARRALQLLPVIQRADQYARGIPIKSTNQPGGRESEPELTPQQAEVAQALGVDPSDQGDLLGAVWDGAKSFGSGMVDGVKSVARAAAGAHPFQKAFLVEAALDEWEAARSPGAKKFAALKLVELAGDDQELVARIKQRIQQ